MDISCLENSSAMFQNCSRLVSLELGLWNANKLNNISDMFRNCSSLMHLDISSMDLKKIKYSNYLFNSMPDDAKVIVKDEENRQWVLNLSLSVNIPNRPSAWKEDNILIKS